MADRLELEHTLRSIAHRIEYPPTPRVAPAVLARLETERARRARPLLPGLALWTRRRILVAVAIAVLALLGLAAAARLSIGAVEVRVQPTRSPTGSPPPPEGPLGEPVSIAQARAAVGFRIALPSGPVPDRAYVVRTIFEHDDVLLTWEPSERYPAVSGTPWGLALLEIAGDEAIVFKSVQSFEDVHDVVVGGSNGYWIPAPHRLELQTDRGLSSYSVRGHVLIWQVGHVTYRLETALGKGEALAIAGSVR